MCVPICMSTFMSHYLSVSVCTHVCALVKSQKLDWYLAYLANKIMATMNCDLVAMPTV